MKSAILLSALSGILLTVGFPKLGLYFLSWVALVPLLLALRGKTDREAFLLGYLCGVIHYVTTLYWIRYVVDHYGGLPFPLAVLILLLLCAYLALYPACFAYLAKKWDGHPILWTLGLPGAWVTMEWIRSHMLTGFPWALMGYTQTPFELLIQVADITGVFGISWLIVFGNTALVAVLRRYRHRVVYVALFSICFVGAMWYGSWRLQEIARREGEAKPLTVAVAQGNIDQSIKWDPLFQQETLRRYYELSMDAANHNPSPELIVWPEAAVPFFYRLEENLTVQLNDIINKIGSPVLFGSLGAERIRGEPRMLNKAYLVDGENNLLGQYAKQHLVPFGEYVPYQSILFFVNKMVEVVGTFAAGNDPSPLMLSRHRLGVLICYEAIFPELARLTVNGGATVLINITNDAWFGTTSAPYQHMEIARWRSIEFRVPMVRSANTGISTVFDASGSSLGTISLNSAGHLTRVIRPVHIQTLYARWGDVFAWLCVFTTLCGMVYPARAVFSRRGGRG